MNGESKSLEFKVALPSKAENYVKTVVAFANGNGGKIVVGIDDKTKQIVGVDDEKVFQIMDAVANTVSDMVEPQIVPNIMLETVNGKPGIIAYCQNAFWARLGSSYVWMCKKYCRIH